MTTLADITKRLKQIVNNIGHSGGRTKVARKLFDIYHWEVVADEAGAEAKRLWKELVDDKDLATDDELRAEFADSEGIALDAKDYAVQVKVVDVTAFNREKFITSVASTFNLRGKKLQKLMELVEAAKEPGTPRLTKNVIPLHPRQVPENKFSGIEVVSTKRKVKVRG